MKFKRILYVCAALLCFASCHDDDKGELVEHNLLTGRWQKNSGTECRRFDSDGGGVKWDPTDDVMESEGKKLHWRWEDEKTLYIEFIMELPTGESTVVPEDYFTVTRLDATVLNYESPDGMTYSFHRI